MSYLDALRANIERGVVTPREAMQFLLDNGVYPWRAKQMMTAIMSSLDTPQQQPV